MSSQEKSGLAELLSLAKLSAACICACCACWAYAPGPPVLHFVIGKRIVLLCMSVTDHGCPPCATQTVPGKGSHASI